MPPTNETILICQSLDSNSIIRLRAIATTLGIQGASTKSKRQLCQQIGNIFNDVIENVQTIEDRNDFDEVAHDFMDHITMELLFEPVKGGDGKWYNKSTYQRLKNENSASGMIFRSPYTGQNVMSTNIPPIDSAKQTEVLQFIRENGLDIPLSESDNSQPLNPQIRPTEAMAQARARTRASYEQLARAIQRARAVEIHAPRAREDEDVVQHDLGPKRLPPISTMIMQTENLNELFLSESHLAIIKSMGFKVFQDHIHPTGHVYYFYIQNGHTFFGAHDSVSVKVHFKVDVDVNKWPLWAISNSSSSRCFVSRSLESLCQYAINNILSHP